MVQKSNRRRKTTPNNNLRLKRPPSHHLQLHCLLNRLPQNSQISKRYSLMAQRLKFLPLMAHYPHSIFNNRHHKRFRLTRNHNKANTASHNRFGVTVFIKIFQLTNVRYARLRWKTKGKLFLSLGCWSHPPSSSFFFHQGHYCGPICGLYKKKRMLPL